MALLADNMCDLILVPACAFGWDLQKSLLFATARPALRSLGTLCRHPRHKGFAGAKDAEGFSSRIAEYPEALAQAFAALIKPLLSLGPGVAVEWDCVLLRGLDHAVPLRCAHLSRRGLRVRRAR